jgi:hypothetical protein
MHELHECELADDDIARWRRSKEGSCVTRVWSRQTSVLRPRTRGGKLVHLTRSGGPAATNGQPPPVRYLSEGTLELDVAKVTASRSRGCDQSRWHPRPELRDRGSRLHRRK